MTRLLRLVHVAASIKQSPSERTRRIRRRAGLALRLSITLAAFAFLSTLVEGKELADAVGRAPLWGVPAAAALNLGALVVASWRWRFVLQAYGAPHRPALLHLLRLHMVGLFYNTYLPGAVGGDVVRGIATREAFGERGTAGALTVVFVERVLGMAGLTLLVACAFYFRPLEGVRDVWLWTILGLAAGFGAVASVAVGRRLSGLFPEPLRRFAASLPPLHAGRPFAAAIGCSIATQACVALAGHVLVFSIAPQVRLLDSLVIVPLAAAGAYFPLTVAGAGAVETLMVLLYASIGVARADALAAALLMLLTKLLVAGLGGVLAVVFPFRPADASKRAS